MENSDLDGAFQEDLSSPRRNPTVLSLSKEEEGSNDELNSSTSETLVGSSSTLKTAMQGNVEVVRVDESQQNSPVLSASEERLGESHNHTLPPSSTALPSAPPPNSVHSVPVTHLPSPMMHPNDRHAEAYYAPHQPTHMRVDPLYANPSAASLYVPERARAPCYTEDLSAARSVEDLGYPPGMSAGWNGAYGVPSHIPNSVPATPTYDYPPTYPSMSHPTTPIHSNGAHLRPRTRHNRSRSNSSNSNASGIRRLSEVDHHELDFDHRGSEDEEDDEGEDSQAFYSTTSDRLETSSRHSRRSASSRSTTPVPPKVQVESYSERLKRQRRTATLILISSIVLFTGLWEMYDVPTYCVSQDISSLTQPYQVDFADGTVSLRSASFSQEDDLILHLELRNTGKPLSGPTAYVYYYNPGDQRPGPKTVEVMYYLRDCKSALGTGVQHVHLRLPFPSERALDMAVAVKAHLYLRIEGDGRTVLSETIPLPPAVIFETWLEKLAGMPCHVIVFGEQGSAKTTIINDFLNMFQGLSSIINYGPPPISIQDASTLGVTRIEIPPPHDTLLDESIVFYDTEGSRM